MRMFIGRSATLPMRFDHVLRGVVDLTIYYHEVAYIVFENVADLTVVVDYGNDFHLFHWNHLISGGTSSLW